MIYMSYASAVESLYALGHELAPQSATSDPAAPPVRARKWDLTHMRTLCHALGDPQTAFASVLIAGTNGKGSTAATLASILAAAGLETALYTSPHLVRPNERIQRSGDRSPLQPISDDDFARCYERVEGTAKKLVGEEALPHMPSFFEMMTAIAFLHFAESGAQVAVLEVGLGGRLDATNIVEPILSILTDISLDHTEWLGHTITEIAREKAGILRPNGVLVTLPQHPEANQAIGEAAVALGVRAINAAAYMPPAYIAPHAADPAFAEEYLASEAGARQELIAGEQEATPGKEDEQSMRSQSSQTPGEVSHVFRNRYTICIDGEQAQVDSPLVGQHQQRNIALAIAAAVELRQMRAGGYPTVAGLTTAAIQAGIRNTRWPGRLELLTISRGRFQGRLALLDVAHNPAGAWALRSALSGLPEDRPRTLLFSCLRDKAVAEIAQILAPLFDRPIDHAVVCPVDNPRSASAEELLSAVGRFARTEAAFDIPAALDRALELTPEGGILVATGSLYLIGEVRSILVDGEERAKKVGPR